MAFQAMSRSSILLEPERELLNLWPDAFLGLEAQRDSWPGRPCYLSTLDALWKDPLRKVPRV